MAKEQQERTPTNGIVVQVVRPTSSVISLATILFPVTSAASRGATGWKETLVPQNIELTELFPDTFIAATSDFAGLDDLVVALGADRETFTRLEELDIHRVNRLIAERTDFACWSDMVQAGRGQFIAARLRKRLDTLPA